MNNKTDPIVLSRIKKLYGYRLPFKTQMQFKQRRLENREGVILQLNDADGESHFAECSPLPGFSQETLDEVKEQLFTLLSGLPVSNNLHPCVEFALSSLIDNGRQPEVINIDNIPLLQGDTKQVIAHYRALKCPTKIKLKVARELVAQDIANFQSICHLNPKVKIRCDANQAWNAQQAALFFSAINIDQLDYIEEPTNNHQLNLQLAKQYQAPLALDETLQDPSFYYQHNTSIKAFIIKPTIIGSTQKIDRLVSLAIKHNIAISFSSSFETIVGLQQLKKLAAQYLIMAPKAQQASITLGIDTLKYFDARLLTNEKKIAEDCHRLEVLWTSNK